MKFTEDNKRVKEFSGGNWFGFGVHKVHIGQIELGTTDNDKEFLEVTVLGDNEEEDTARVWFTTDKAAEYSFNIMRQIYIHNAKEADKDKARDEFDALGDTIELADLMQKCVGKECWFTKYPNPTRTYTNQAGEVKPSIDKNIMGYEPKLREDLLPKDTQVKDEVHEPTDADIKGDTPLNIPKSW